LYFVLAEDERCSVVTADQRFLNAFYASGRVIDLSQV